MLLRYVEKRNEMGRVQTQALSCCQKGKRNSWIGDIFRLPIKFFFKKVRGWSFSYLHVQNYFPAMDYNYKQLERVNAWVTGQLDSVVTQRVLEVKKTGIALY